MMATACSSNTTKVTPSPTTSTTIESPSTTSSSTTTSTTEIPVTTTPVEPPAPQSNMEPTEPILCDRYRHPLHHLTCEQADVAADKKKIASTASNAPATTPRSSTPAPTPTSSSALQDCIARYESENGRTSSNQYQFVQGTWAAYGGTGSAENATMSEQNAVFDRAWADGGEQHWAAQKGRCF